MTRKKQIEKAAIKICEDQSYRYHFFKRGAQWADANPNLNDFGKETLILQACYRKIDKLTAASMKVTERLNLIAHFGMHAEELPPDRLSEFSGLCIGALKIIQEYRDSLKDG